MNSNSDLHQTLQMMKKEAYVSEMQNLALLPYLILS